MSKRERTKKMNIILIVVLSAILVLFAAEFIVYNSLKVEAEKYKTADVSIAINDRLDLVGLLDSYGVPFSPEVNDSFFDIYAKELGDEGRLESELDIFGLYLNKTWHMDGIFKNSITVGEMTEMQNFSIDFVRHKYGNHIRTDLKYSCPKDMEDKTIYDHVAGLDNPVICYSCSANDLFYYYGFSLEGLNTKRCIEFINGFDDARNFLSTEVEGNVNTLLECNPDSQIYVLGLYVPSDNFFLQRLGSIAINLINRDLKAICNKYDNVHFVDISCVSFAVLDRDFHPDQDGQRIVAVKLAETINNTYVPLNSERIPDASRNNTPEKTETDYSKYINDIVDGINNTHLPIDDYVEASVAIEQILYDLKIEKMDYQDLSILKSAIISGVKPDIRMNITRGIEICIIERKILFGVTESDYSSHPETVLNDKLSLIEYY